MAYYTGESRYPGHPRHPEEERMLGRRGVRTYTMPASQFHERYPSPPDQYGPVANHRVIATPPEGLDYQANSLRRSTKASTVRRDKDRNDSPRVIDVIGSGHELTVTGHIQLLKLLPLRHSLHRQLLETYAKNPGNYEGRYNDDTDSVARILDYGGGYLAIRLYDDISRPELSEFLIRKEWRLIGFSSMKEEDKTLIYEKWTNMHNRAGGTASSEALNGYYS